MKIVFLLILLFTLDVKSQKTSSFKQHEIEAAILNQLNEYRNKHGLRPFVADTTISKIARLHARYLAIVSEMGHSTHYDNLPHDEQFDVPNYQELNFDERMRLAPNKNISLEISIQSQPIINGQTLKEFALQTIKLFDSSSSHKELMLINDTKGIVHLAGVGVVKHETKNDGYEFYAVNIDFGYYQVDKK